MKQHLGPALVGIALAAHVAVPVGAQDATPPALPTVPAPAECDVEPRSIESVESVLAAGTPVPEVDVASEAELPRGRPADAETVAAVTAVELAFVACLNAADWPRVLALMTDDAIRSFVPPGESVADLFATTGTPQADAGGVIQTVLVDVRDVRVLPDGRVGAVVEWGRVGSPGAPVDEANFHVFENVDGRWLLDEEIGSFISWHQADGTPPAWQIDGTPAA